MREYPIALGGSSHEKYWVNKKITFEDLKKRLETPIRTTESAEEYSRMKKKDRDKADEAPAEEEPEELFEEAEEEILAEEEPARESSRGPRKGRNRRRGKEKAESGAFRG